MRTNLSYLKDLLNKAKEQRDRTQIRQDLLSDKIKKLETLIKEQEK